MEFIKLHTVNGRETIIHKRLIQCITDRCGYSTIFFSENDLIEVTENIEEIYKMLNTEEIF